MNRADLQAISEDRATDARVLLDAGRFSAAYYLLGYAVECALKACIAKQIKADDFPDKELIVGSYTHDLDKLLRLSGTKGKFDEHVKVNEALEVNWTTVKDWNESQRYNVNISEQAARDLWNATTDPKSGVLTWLKTVW